MLLSQQHQVLNQFESLRKEQLIPPPQKHRVGCNHDLDVAAAQQADIRKARSHFTRQCFVEELQAPQPVQQTSPKLTSHVQLKLTAQLAS